MQTTSPLWAEQLCVASWHGKALPGAVTAIVAAPLNVRSSLSGAQLVPMPGQSAAVTHGNPFLLPPTQRGSVSGNRKLSVLTPLRSTIASPDWAAGKQIAAPPPSCPAHVESLASILVAQLASLVSTTALCGPVGDVKMTVTT